MTPSWMPHAPDNAYVHPRPGWMGRRLSALANSAAWARWRRAAMSRLPFPALQSEVTDVVYLTWLAPLEACAAWVPAGLRLWQRGGLTPFTVLSYRHGNFGPAALGPLRRCLPSPLQSNWRLYLETAPPGTPGAPTVLFLKNAIGSLPHALATRLFSDALPTHLPAAFTHRRQGDVWRTRIDPGAGSAPALDCAVELSAPRPAPVLGPAWAGAFGTWREAVRFLALQDAAVAPLADGRLAFAEIELPVDLDGALPAALSDSGCECPLARALRPVEDAPFCFVVPRVGFKVVSERVL